jgi:hypothetical protein
MLFASGQTHAVRPSAFHPRPVECQSPGRDALGEPRMAFCVGRAEVRRRTVPRVPLTHGGYIRHSGRRRLS